jgi:hypothetical protein
MTQDSLNRACVVVALGLVLGVPLTGCATAHGPRRLDEGVTLDAWSWSRVGELRPGVEVAIAAGNAPLRPRIFVSANASEVIVVNLDVPSLPQAAIHALRDMATRRSEFFTAIPANSSFEQDRVRLGRDGLFVADRRIAAYDQIVETLARETVREIRGPVVARGSVLGTIVGGWLGFSVGAVPGLGGAKPAAAWASLAGSVMLGGWLGHRWSSHTVEGVVYHSP